MAYEGKLPPAAPGGMYENANLTAIQGVGRLLREVDEGTETVFNLVEDLTMEKGQVLKVERRKLNPEPPIEPKLARAPKRLFTFHNIDSFIDYVVKHQSDNSLVLADACSRKGVFVYDESVKDCDFEIAEYHPTIHPLLDKWRNLKMPAKDFAQFVMEQRESIVYGAAGESSEDEDEQLSARDIAMMFRQVRQSKNITIETGVGSRAINGVMVEVKIGSSADTHQIQMALPDFIMLQIPFFVQDEQPGGLQFDLLVYSGPNDVPYVSASNGSIESLMAKEFTRGINKLREVVPDVLVTMGSFDTEDWRTVR